MKKIFALVIPAGLMLSLLSAGCAGLGAAAAVGAVVYYKSSQHEVATVNLDAYPDKVYATAIETIEAAEGTKITKQDPKAGLIEVTKDKQKISLKITPLKPKLTQLTVTSTVTKDEEPGSTTAVLNGVAEICDKMGVAHHVVK